MEASKQKESTAVTKNDSSVTDAKDEKKIIKNDTSSKSTSLSGEVLIQHTKKSKKKVATKPKLVQKTDLDE